MVAPVALFSERQLGVIDVVRKQVTTEIVSELTHCSHTALFVVDYAVCSWVLIAKHPMDKEKKCSTK